MKTLKFKVTAIILVVALALTGCMTAQEDIVINSDGTATITAMVRMDKQAYISGMQKMAAEFGEASLTEEELKVLDENLKEQGYKIVNIEGKEYYQSIKREAIKKGQLQSEFASQTGASYVTTDTFYMQEGAMGEEMLEDYKDAGVTADSVKITITVKMPKEIVSTNGTIDPEDKTKVSFDVPVDKELTLFATTKSGVTINSVKATIKDLNKIGITKITKLKANKVKKKAKTATVTVKYKKASQATKYKIQYSTKKSFKKYATTSKTTKKTSYTIKKLKKNKKYYVRVRAVKTNYAGIDVYSAWTKAKSVKTKK